MASTPTQMPAAVPAVGPCPAVGCAETVISLDVTGIGAFGEAAVEGVVAQADGIEVVVVCLQVIKHVPAQWRENADTRSCNAPPHPKPPRKQPSQHPRTRTQTVTPAIMASIRLLTTILQALGLQDTEFGSEAFPSDALAGILS